MIRSMLTAGVCAVLLWASAGWGAVTPQESCDNARIAAWKTYVSCVEAVVAKDAKQIGFNEDTAFAKCRHAYFRQWTVFQTRVSLATSSCRPAGGQRFTDNLDGTVTDNLSGLVWEQKTSDSSVHDVGNSYAWSTGAPFAEDGTVFTGFLATVNGADFAGAAGWRLPTIAELQTILPDFTCTAASCTCPSTPCVDPTVGLTQFNASTFNFYWSSVTWVPSPNIAWVVDFKFGVVTGIGKATFFDFESDFYARAVRGGL